MAHQAHNIPWNVLASNLSWRSRLGCKNGATDFHWRFKADQGKEITYFAKAFAKTIGEHADCERKKFPLTYAHPEEDDIVLSDETCRKIYPTVRHSRLLQSPDNTRLEYDPKVTHVLCPDRRVDPSDEGCSCALPWKERLYSSMTRLREHSSCYEFWRINGEAFFSMEIFEILLLHAEMDTLLRIYSHGEHSLPQWWDCVECQCVNEQLGWDRLCKFALRSYILLNTVHCFPETWEQGHSPDKDYRNTRAYQDTVLSITGPGDPDRSDNIANVPTFPHRQFFGIADDKFRGRWETTVAGSPRYIRSQFIPLGCVSYEEFLKIGNPTGYTPLLREVDEVRWILRAKGLPLELADEIMREAEYGSCVRRLPVQHDPFHPENREELDKYLKYCFALLVRCEVIARVADMDLDWEGLVGEELLALFECSNHASYKMDHSTYPSTIVFNQGSSGSGKGPS